MRRHFLDRGDPETAAVFRPSSMEYVRSLGGDPLTFVSEMPLFLLPPPETAYGFPDPATGTKGNTCPECFEPRVTTLFSKESRWGFRVRLS